MRGTLTVPQPPGETARPETLPRLLEEADDGPTKLRDWDPSGPVTWTRGRRARRDKGDTGDTPSNEALTRNPYPWTQ